MTVWIVLTWGGGPLGVFSSKELADAYAAAYPGRVEIEEHEIDAEALKTCANCGAVAPDVMRREGDSGDVEHCRRCHRAALAHGAAHGLIAGD